MTAALEEGEWSAARPGTNLPPEKTRYPFYRSLGGPQGRSRRVENLVPTRIRSPDRPARSSVAIPTELPFYPRKRPGTHFTGVWLGPRAGLDGWKISSPPGFDPRTVQPVAQWLYRLSYHFTPGKDPVPILQESGWAPGPVSTGGKSRPHQDSIPGPSSP